MNASYTVGVCVMCEALAFLSLSCQIDTKPKRASRLSWKKKRGRGNWKITLGRKRERKKHLIAACLQLSGTACLFFLIFCNWGKVRLLAPCKKKKNTELGACNEAFVQSAFCGPHPLSYFPWVQGNRGGRRKQPGSLLGPRDNGIN